MGSSGAFLKSGGFSNYNWDDIGSFHGIKILKKNIGNKRQSLPIYSNTPGTGYLLFKENRFYQYRQYGEDRKAVFDLDYSEHQHKISLHLHYYINGEHGKSPIIIATHKDGIIEKELYKKFKPLLKGIKI